ncbi:MAG: AarF/UbiB family protein [Actinomycetota bacterium]
MSDTAAAKRTLVHNSKRVGQIISTIAHYGYASWVTGGMPDQFRSAASHIGDRSLLEMSDGERLRHICLDLGTTFIKIGQLLSTRSDLVGEEIASELASLQGHVPPDPPDVIRATLESELGRPIEEVFTEFNDEPLGSASIAQVHAAQLIDGTEVVVKIQHAGVRDLIEKDLDILEALAVLVEAHDDELALYRPVAVASQLRRSLLAEIDFNLEAANLSRFRENFADEPDVVIPEPYLEASSGAALTMSFLEGAPLSDVISDLGEKADTFARRGAEIYIEMVFRDSMFHADPHPGNIVMMDGDRVGFLDFGKVGRIDDDLSDLIDDIVIAALSRDLDGLSDGIIRICDAPPTLDRGALRSDLGDWIDRYISVGAANIDMSGAADAADKILRRHRLFMPPDVVLLMRTLVQLQGMLVETGVDVTIQEVLEPYAAMIAARQFAPKRLLRGARRTARDYERLIETFPVDAAAILEGIRRGLIEIPLDVRGLDRSVNRLVYAAITATLFAGSSRLWSSKVPPTIGGVSVPGAVGTIAAGAFAIRLLRAAHRAGGLG